jgi:hypothetical protein
MKSIILLFTLLFISIAYGIPEEFSSTQENLQEISSQLEPFKPRAVRDEELDIDLGILRVDLDINLGGDIEISIGCRRGQRKIARDSAVRQGARHYGNAIKRDKNHGIEKAISRGDSEYTYKSGSALYKAACQRKGGLWVLIDVEIELDNGDPFEIYIYICLSPLCNNILDLQAIESQLSDLTGFLTTILL